MTIYYLCPLNRNVPTGGVKKIYDHVDILNRAGIPAAVVQGRRGFRPSWFPNRTRVEYAPVQVDGRDVLVFPEVFGSAMATPAPGVPRVSFNQNAYLTFSRVEAGEPHPYSASPDLLAVIVVSDDSRTYIEYGWPSLPVHRVTNGVDTDFWSPGLSPRRRDIVYMPRKAPDISRQVLGLLASRGALRGWRVTPLDGANQMRVAESMRSGSLFLQFTDLEGFGLPVAEALASGCTVIGFTGMGGQELYEPSTSVAVPANDVLAFARAVEAWLAEHRSGPIETNWEGVRFARARYSSRVEEESVLNAWSAVLSLRGGARAGRGVITAADTRAGLTLSRRAGARIRHAAEALTGRP